MRSFPIVTLHGPDTLHRSHHLTLEQNVLFLYRPSLMLHGKTKCKNKTAHLFLNHQGVPREC
jgi:hypothetical protein